jgi:hypothetical protein
MALKLDGKLTVKGIPLELQPAKFVATPGLKNFFDKYFYDLIR